MYVYNMYLFLSGKGRQLYMYIRIHDRKKGQFHLLYTHVKWVRIVSSSGHIVIGNGLTSKTSPAQ